MKICTDNTGVGAWIIASQLVTHLSSRENRNSLKLYGFVYTTS